MGYHDVMDGRYGSWTVLVSLILFTIVVLFAVPALAHRVTLFAWVEGDIVNTESKFGGGRMVKGGLITVYDLQGNKLLEGRTDDEGAFSFPAPGRMALRLELLAGMGHRAEWLLEAEELADLGTDLGTGTKADLVGTGTDTKEENGERHQDLGGETAMGTGTRQEGVMVSSVSAVSALDAEEIQTVVETALDKKLQPLIRMLALSRDQGPSVRDIVGGIGYIMGLVGVAAYVHSRKNRKG